MKKSIYLGGGCFWCIEAVYDSINGVLGVESGYAGGESADVTYEQVTTGTTGHAEVVKVTFESNVINLMTILEIFFLAHDPTTLNRQGNDVGTQYRSIIMCENTEDKDSAEEAVKQLENNTVYKDPIVTQVEPVKNYVKAELYHQEYYKNNPGQGYRQFIIKPKVEKLKTVFADLQRGL